MDNKPLMFNDLKAPRFNPRKLRYNVVGIETYKKFKKEQKSSMSYSQFRTMWERIANQIMASVIDERDGVRIRGLGDLYIGYTKTKDKPIDRKLSEEYGKIIYHENWHTNGKVMKIIFGVSKRRYIFKRKYWWSFEGARDFVRNSSAAVKKDPLKYKDSQEKRGPSNKVKIEINDEHNNSWAANIRD